MSKLDNKFIKSYCFLVQESYARSQQFSIEKKVNNLPNRVLYEIAVKHVGEEHVMDMLDAARNGEKALARYLKQHQN